MHIVTGVTHRCVLICAFSFVVGKNIQRQTNRCVLDSLNCVYANQESHVGRDAIKERRARLFSFYRKQLIMFLQKRLERAGSCSCFHGGAKKCRPSLQEMVPVKSLVAQ